MSNLNYDGFQQPQGKVCEILNHEKSTSLQVFNNPQFGQVRVAGTPENPLFCLPDICKVVGLTNPTTVKNRLDSEDVQLIDLHALNSKEVLNNNELGNRESNFVTESGFYDVLLQSSSKSVKPFRKWVTSEVLPSIRKTGGYSVSQFSIPTTFSEALRLAASQAEQIEQQQKLIEEQAPKALFADSVASSETSILIGELAKILKQNGINVGQNRLFNQLRNDGYLGKKGENYNIPTQYSMDLKLFEIKERTIVQPDGSIRITKTCKVTGKGQIYFINKFMKGNIAC